MNEPKVGFHGEMKLIDCHRQQQQVAWPRRGHPPESTEDFTLDPVAEISAQSIVARDLLRRNSVHGAGKSDAVETKFRTPPLRSKSAPDERACARHN